MAAKTWSEDFRFPAIQASIRQLRGLGDADPFDLDQSWCIPVAEKPVIGLSPGKISLLVLFFGFALMGAGVSVINVGEKQGSSLLMGLGAVLSLCGFGCFFVPVKADRLIITRMIGERARKLKERAGLTPLMSSELSNPDPSGLKLSIDGDDHVLILPDRAERRLLIEGTGARYHIRADDVKTVRPFEFMSYVGAEIICAVDDAADLRVAVARTSISKELINQIPLLFFLRKRIRNPLLAVCRECLEFSDEDQQPGFTDHTDPAD